jgi:parvulin-like peptidyl-prolyl isomerase
MNSQTARRADPPDTPGTPRTSRSSKASKAKAKRYSRQTAHVEARRDGTPLIFGWGGHLTRAEKTQLQQRAVWATTIGIALIIIAVMVGFWINVNIITPGLPITSVNGQQISQSDYRKLVAVKAQLEDNKIYGAHGLVAQENNIQKQMSAQQAIVNNEVKQIDTLNAQLQALPAKDTAQRANIEVALASARATSNAAQTQYQTLSAEYQDANTNVANEENLYVQSQIGNDSADWLQDDVFIRTWLATQSSSVQAKINPTASAVNKAVADLTANLPTGTTYSSFLKSDNISDADVHAMMALILRRQNMQNYLASQITSPAYQVSVRVITSDTQAHANAILQQLKNGADFATLARQKSVDSSTNSKGGYLGWLAKGQYAEEETDNNSALIDNWIFNPTRTINEISPVMAENGSFHIIQILGIDPSRPIDATTLQSLQSNALTLWLLSQKAMPGVKITPIDQTKLLDPGNMPPGLPSSPPSQQVPGANGGLPGSTGLP